MTADLIAFLRDRLDEDEQAARAAAHGGSGRWLAEEPSYGSYAVADDRKEPVVYDEGQPTVERALHIARHDPARVLAEVDAKRRIIAAHEQTAQLKWPDDPDMILTVRQRITNQAIGQEEGLMTALRLLALPYADHPDYRPEWAPDACRKGEA